MLSSPYPPQFLLHFAGFAIAYAYSIVGIFQFTSRLQADVSARFFSVQRIVDYTTVVPVEDSDEGALPGCVCCVSVCTPPLACIGALVCACCAPGAVNMYSMCRLIGRRSR
eukprot:m.1441135 g.1441135  ORF g.1441135 m.1441135 type:complete len:111 (-) comp25094_c0_seq42:3079-3411(-)